MSQTRETDGRGPPLFFIGHILPGTWTGFFVCKFLWRRQVTFFLRSLDILWMEERLSSWSGWTAIERFMTASCWLMNVVFQNIAPTDRPAVGGNIHTYHILTERESEYRSTLSQKQGSISEKKSRWKVYGKMSPGRYIFVSNLSHLPSEIYWEIR